MKRLASRDYETLLDMAAELQEAAAIEEVAGRLFRAVARFDPHVSPIVELRGAWGHRRVLRPDNAPMPENTFRFHGLAWKIVSNGVEVHVVLSRSGEPFDSDPDGCWAELRRQTTPAFLRACEYQRMQDETTVLRDELARAGAAMLLVDSHGAVVPPSDQTRKLLERHSLTGSRLDALLARVRERLDLLPPTNTVETIGSGETPAGILRFLARSTARGVLRALYIEETDRFLPPSRFAKLGLSPRRCEVLHWLVEGKTNPEIAIILGIGVESVKDHVRAIFAKLGVRNRGELARVLRENP